MSQATILDAEAAYALWAANYPARAHNPVMQAEERAMLAMLPADMGGRSVLDAGCGSGRYLLHAWHRGAGSLTGIDSSQPMLSRAAAELAHIGDVTAWRLAAGSVMDIPVADATADITICGLVLGHVPGLSRALGELARVTRPGGCILCSDFHPIGHALGWLRDFRLDGRRYAARHFPHLYSHWHKACVAAGLVIEEVHEPMLDPADIPAGAHFDPAALSVPAALAFRLRRAF